MVDALAAPGAALVATPDSGKRTSERATRTWCTPARAASTSSYTARRCMQYEARGFYILFACCLRYTYMLSAGAKPRFYCRRAPTKGFVSLRFIAATRFVLGRRGKVVSPFYALTRLSAPSKRNCCSTECSLSPRLG